MVRYSIEPRTRIFVKGYGFLSFARNLFDQYGKKLWDVTTKPELAKAAPRMVVHKITEAADELIGNKIAENIMKPKSVSVENSRNDKEINIPPEKR